VRWPSSRQSLVAVDCGARSVRAVQLAFGEELPTVVHWLNTESRSPVSSPASAGTAGAKEAAGTSVSLAGIEQFDTRRAGLLVGPSEAEYCLLTVPGAVWSQDPASLADAIRWEVGRRLSCPIDEAELGAWPLPGPMGGGSNAMAVAAQRPGIVSAIGSLDSEHMDCERVEPAALSLVRACRASALCEQDEIWGVLDLGHTGNRLYLAVDSTPVFARSVRGGGHNWTQLIAKELRVEPALAEDYKRKSGIGTDARGCRTSPSSVERLSEAALPGVLLSILRGPLADMLADVERAFRFVMEQYPRRQAGALVLVGGGSRMPGLADWLSRELGVKAAPAGSNGVLKITPSHPMSRTEIYSVMAGCVGMALGEGPP